MVYAFIMGVNYLHKLIYEINNEWHETVGAI
jgi:hypothetical protein